MDEAFVRLLCPECNKAWESSPGDLPKAGEMFHCPNCHASRHTSVFMRTERDLETLKQFA